MSAFSGATGGRISGIKGTGYKQISSPTMTSEQQALLSQLIGGLRGGVGGGLDFLSKLAGGGDESFWQQEEAPAMRQFAGLMGGMASRFSGGGGMGGGQAAGSLRGSSGFQNTMGEAGADFAERLAGMRSSRQQQAISELLGLSQNLLGQRSFETGFLPKKTPFWKEMLLGLSGSVGQAAGTFGGLGFR